MNDMADRMRQQHDRLLHHSRETITYHVATSDDRSFYVTVRDLPWIRGQAGGEDGIKRGIEVDIPISSDPLVGITKAQVYNYDAHTITRSDGSVWMVEQVHISAGLIKVTALNQSVLRRRREETTRPRI